MLDDDTDIRPKGTRSFGVLINTKATGKTGSQERVASESTQEGASLSDTGELTKEKEKERPLCFAARKETAPAHEISGQGAHEKIRPMLARCNCVQPYSVMYAGGRKFVVLWDSGCTMHITRVDGIQRVHEDA